MNAKTVKKSKTFVVIRDAKTGECLDVKTDKRSPATTTVGRKKMTGSKVSGRYSKSGKFVEEKHRVRGKSAETISETSEKRNRVLENLAKR